MRAEASVAIPAEPQVDIEPSMEIINTAGTIWGS